MNHEPLTIFLFKNGPSAATPLLPRRYSAASPPLLRRFPLLPRGHYDTKPACERILANVLSGRMALPPALADITTRNPPYSVFSLTYCPEKWN